MKQPNKIVIFLIMIFVLLILLMMYQYISNRKIENFESKKTIELIIARYNEDLKWTLDKPFNQFEYIVYNKGFNEDFEKSRVKQIIPLENVGKCDHTYLYHIVKNYNNLSDINVFLPGSLNMSKKIDTASKLLKNITIHNLAIFCGHKTNSIKDKFSNFYIDSYRTEYSKNQNSKISDKLKPCNIRPYGKWYDANFGSINAQYYCYYGIFSIAKKDILQHNVDYYDKFVKELNYPNPEVGHYIERSWAAIFYPFNDTKYIDV